MTTYRVLPLILFKEIHFLKWVLNYSVSNNASAVVFKI